MTARIRYSARLVFAVSGVLLQTCAASMAGEADVVGVEVSTQDSTYRFAVTVRHADEGWDHYADKWEVVGDDGTVHGERVLLHPHENEQPFTRSQTGIVIPEGILEVVVRAHDKVHGLGGKEMRVRMPDR